MNAYEANFTKNLEALEEYNAILADKIEGIKSNERFEVFAGKSTFDINIYDHELKQSFYDNPEKFFDEKYNEIYTKYERYPVLFFYGLGNGLLYKALLKNENHKSIVVFEPNIEILYIVFHLIDFSEELKEKRLYVVDANDFDMMDIIAYFSGTLGLRSYLYDSKIFSHCNYYDYFQSSIDEINHNLEQNLNFLYSALGFNVERYLDDMQKYICNIPKMISHPPLKDLIQQRKDKIENAIIVSTGPSLIKQLPLLKEYANKATIICVDGSYPILAKHNIKPDYVVCLEQNDLSSEFFNNDFGDFDKNILFVISDSAHSKTLEYLESNNRNYMLISKNTLLHKNFLHLQDFGTLGGLNVSTMAYSLALKLEHKNIILIGQDLAYDENLNSHPKEFLHGSNLDTNRYEPIKTLAYGGKGEVYTHGAWNTYRQNFEFSIQDALKKGITTYNATEGGSRINHAKEESFEAICQNLLLKEKQIIFEPLYYIDTKKQLELAKNAYDSLVKIIPLAEKKTTQCEEILIPILNLINQTSYQIDLEKIDFVKLLDINEKLHKIKEFLEDENMGFFSEALTTALASKETTLAKISMMSAHTQEDKKIRMIMWVIAHEEWLKIVIDTLKKQISTIKNSLTNLKNFIEENS
ncbi:motility associated factor glycosyltransferase family protein [Campylobacter sp. RM16704]|uniref:motility associated factor glycosyltransferase family protein n=1 Tax=Campylobacter sp. RM16704 TaxID=1500960 RepID=UPI00057EC681|nr:motility accessory factor [Campylobacter sp. RM16704]AJC85678.1 motility accessory factor [Campylobacter sp. RM16704]